MSYSAKEESQKIEDDGEPISLTTVTSPTITINRKSAAGSIATDQPLSSLTFETIYDVKAAATPATKQLDPYSDYSTFSSGSNLDTLDLVTSIVPLITTPTPTKFLISQRHHETKPTNNLQSTLIPPSTFIPPAVSPPEFTTTTEGRPTDSYADNELKTQNLRRHSHEEHDDYDIECDPTEPNYTEPESTEPNSTEPNSTEPDRTEPNSPEPDFVHNLHSEPADTFDDKSSIQLSLTSTERPLVTTKVQTVTIGESMRRMSESDEMSTECDSAEDLKETPKSSTIIGPSNELPASINLITDKRTTTGRTAITDSMRRMSESHEMQTECDSLEEIDQTVTEPFVTEITSISPTVYLTEPVESTTMSPFNDQLTSLKPTLPVNVMSRRMSESDVECNNGNSNELLKLMDNDGIAILMTPISDSMRRMSDSKENSSGGCDWHEDFVEVTTITPSLSGSMRRMSSQDQQTTEQNFDDHTEYVTECDTVVPETSMDAHKTVAMKKNATLECCPDMVCSLLYPNMPICNKPRTANYTRKLAELRDMFYLNRAHVLITEIVGETTDEYSKKRINSERDLVGLWNDMLSISPNNITEGCTNSSSSNVKQIISSIYCVLKYTDTLQTTDSVLEMVVDAAKRVETEFNGSTGMNYPKFRRILLQSLPKVPNRSNTVSALANYMQHNRNYENERLLLLQLLIDIQQRFEKKTEKYIVSQMNIQIRDASKSLQKNGVGVNLHRTLN
ncbi:uncharacterized protein LOC119084466 isoform X2 [Bradysia coprophila]|nr:uncharacterized protein LOC119084466 isoform X2 [Bradysia coprophila]